MLSTRGDHFVHPFILRVNMEDKTTASIQCGGTITSYIKERSSKMPLSKVNTAGIAKVTSYKLHFAHSKKNSNLEFIILYIIIIIYNIINLYMCFEAFVLTQKHVKCNL